MAIVSRTLAGQWHTGFDGGSLGVSVICYTITILEELLNLISPSASGGDHLASVVFVSAPQFVPHQTHEQHLLGTCLLWDGWVNTMYAPVPTPGRDILPSQGPDPCARCRPSFPHDATPSLRPSPVYQHGPPRLPTGSSRLSTSLDQP